MPEFGQNSFYLHSSRLDSQNRSRSKNLKKSKNSSLSVKNYKPTDLQNLKGEELFSI